MTPNTLGLSGPDDDKPRRKSSYVPKYANKAERKAAQRAAGRAAALRQSAERQAANVAAGKPPLDYVARGREFRFLDTSIEPIYLEEAQRLGLLLPGLSSQQHRQIAKRLAERKMAEAIADAPRPTDRVTFGAVPGADADDATRIAFWSQEGPFRRARADRDRLLVQRHELMADEADRQLAAILSRRQGGRP